MGTYMYVTTLNEKRVHELLGELGVVHRKVWGREYVEAMISGLQTGKPSLF